MGSARTVVPVRHVWREALRQGFRVKCTGGELIVVFPATQVRFNRRKHEVGPATLRRLRGAGLVI